ncbi:SDR family oxidoreductase [uncultured Chitinophaga sp.]|jgi:Short-chain dehydrogenases of various substrate specificities|uniref:SDR family NAD(P)-dependent oxidoreductase n=1 Tax=uncultured Chitinophaga sp. TaxID=339340 RepID=UPI002607569C|nr:SDR family oxidoreductase [uncultured Chitinophaga sp.]
MSSYALITGASRGIGRSLATLLARRKYNLLLVARSSDELATLAATLAAENGIEAHYLALDLSLPGAAQQVYNWCTAQQFSVSLLVNNAGYGVWGYFDELPLNDQSNMLQLNMQLAVELSYYIIPLLKQHPKAYILNVGSTAAYQAVPTMTLYAASKSFMLSFSRGLRYELKRTQISVSCLCPGPVNTHFIERAKMQAIQATAEKFGMTPDLVAAQALKGLFAGKAEIIPGTLNAISALGARLLPKAMIERIAANLYKTK